MDRIALIQPFSDTQKDYMLQIREALAEEGINAEIFDLSGDQETIAQELIRLAKGNFDAAFTINSRGEHALKLDEDTLFFDAIGVPFFNYIVDHPLEHFAHLRGCGDQYHLLCVDRDHVEFVRKYYPEVKHVDFLPHSARSRHEDAETVTRDDFFSRGNGLVFVGTYYNVTQKLDEKFAGYRDFHRQMIYEMIGQADKHRAWNIEELTLSVVGKLTGAENFSVEEKVKFMELLCECITYIRVRMREKILRAAAESGESIDIYGGGWEEMEALKDFENVRLHGRIATKEVGKIYRHARLALNVMPWFKNGSHERIGDIMLRGAAVLTDPSRYLQELFRDGEEVYYYDIEHPEGLSERIRELLREPEKLFAVAQRGQQYAMSHLRVSDLVQQLMILMEESL